MIRFAIFLIESRVKMHVISLNHYDQKPEIHLKKDIIEFSLDLLERNSI